MKKIIMRKKQKHPFDKKQEEKKFVFCHTDISLLNMRQRNSKTLNDCNQMKNL